MQINDVLIPVDFSTASLNAIEFTVKLMRGEGEIHLLHVVDMKFIRRVATEGIGDESAIRAQMTQRAEEQLQQLAERYRTSNLTVQTIVVAGTPFVEILRLAKQLEFQLIVLGTHGHRLESIEQALFGTTPEQVLRGAPIPVLTVPVTTAPE